VAILVRPYYVLTRLVIIDVVVMKVNTSLTSLMSVSVVNISLPITNIGLDYVIAGDNFGLANSFNGCLTFVALDDIFHCYG
jgi:hypothetical protein